MGAATAFTLFSGPVFAETVQITPDTGNTYTDRSFFAEEHLLGEGLDGAGEVDLGFFGGATSYGNDDSNTYSNSLWLFPYSDTGTDARYWHDQGNYEYRDGAVESNYYIGEDGRLIYARRDVGNPGTGVWYFHQYEDEDGTSPSYRYEYYDADVEERTIFSDAPFDTDALLASINGDIPASRYGIFDFENSWIDYEGDGLGPISLAQLLETGVYGEYFAYFNNGAVDGMSWESAFPIASVEIAYHPITASVPEPETWGMLLSGLGLVGFIARRRRKHV
ncbi:MAG: PEPxxWA-CTERM sorting domain-containing protein [Azoarcus sp.]|nr:PEPxxWA-CTERM sorting domain-containing protein [Azoarcus sp.]